MEEPRGWKPIPLCLNILFSVLTIWILGSIFAIPARVEAGLPFFGIYFYEIRALLILVLLDIIAPLTFLVGFWNRKSWAPMVAFIYMGIFVSSSAVTFYTLKAELGVLPIVIPAVLTLLFMIVIFSQRDYFK